MADMPYNIVGTPVQIDYFDNQLQRAVEGWEVTAQWKANGSLIRVKVPKTAQLAPAADILIRQQGAELDELHALGH